MGGKGGGEGRKGRGRGWSQQEKEGRWEEKTPAFVGAVGGATWRRRGAWMWRGGRGGTDTGRRRGGRAAGYFSKEEEEDAEEDEDQSRMAEAKTGAGREDNQTHERGSPHLGGGNLDCRDPLLFLSFSILLSGFETKPEKLKNINIHGQANKLTS